MKRLFIILFAAAAMAGCQSYDIVQRAIFSDDDGSLVSVDYGRSESEHVNYFTSPVNGKKLSFKSRLVVRVTLPDGDSFVAWQCMNFQRTGTMYKTDDEEWMALMNGFACIVYRQQEDGRYREAYRGVMCDTPAIDGSNRKKSYIVKPPDQAYQPKQ